MSTDADVGYLAIAKCGVVFVQQGQSQVVEVLVGDVAADEVILSQSCKKQ